MLYSTKKRQTEAGWLLLHLLFLSHDLGVLVGLLFDRSGNMFYAPAFTSFFGGVRSSSILRK